MFKLVIVDDEYLIRELISNSVDWQAINIEIVAQAEDGQEAIEVVEKFKPDIILIDINIPFINGIDLAQVLRDKYPKLRIVILTGYGEFAYAQKAIGIGVYAYLLKPIDAGELTQVMTNITDELTRLMAQDIYINELKVSAYHYRLSKKNEFLNSLIYSKTLHHENKILKLAEKNKVSFSKKEKYIITMEISKLSMLFPEKTEQYLWAYAACNIAQEILMTHDTCIVFVTDDYHVVSIISRDNQSIDSICNACNRVIEAVRKYVNLDSTIAISNAFTKLNMIYTEYRHTIQALGEKFYTGMSVVNGEKASKKSMAYPHLSIDQEKILLACKTGDSTLLNNVLDSLVEGVMTYKIDREIVNIKFIEFITYVVNAIPQDEELKENIIQLYEQAKNEIIQSETVSELQDKVKFYCTSLLALSNAKTESKAARMVGDAQEYIKNNYARYALALDEIASNIYISPNYLSKIFKKECNQTVVEYITEYRMQKAVELVEKYPNIQVNILAQKIGFSDPFYFSRLFKKRFGTSPSKYIEYKTNQ